MNRDTSVYVHFPWCLKKCPYCDFATRRIDAPAIPHAAYADGVLRQLEDLQPELDGRRLVSVFFGGGTPSLWQPDELGRALRGIRDAFANEAHDLEVTVECNPSSLDIHNANAFAAQGVGRLSVGVQSLSDKHLGFLGRLHDRAKALSALDVALRAVPRVSADLMFGMPQQSTENLRGDVAQLLDRGVTHVSAYALTVEPGTRFGELRRKGKLAIAPDDDYAAMYLAAEAALTESGFEHYEVSNYAIHGEESLHNAHYWRGGDYVGLGAGAVGCLTLEPGRALRFKNEPTGERWLEGAPPVESETLGPTELVREGLMLGLRTLEGMQPSTIEARAGRKVIEGREMAVADRSARGDLIREGNRWRVPRDRWLRLDGIVADLF